MTNTNTGSNTGHALIKLLAMLRFIDESDKEYARIRESATTMAEAKDLTELLEDIAGLISRYAGTIEAGSHGQYSKDTTSIHEILIQLLERIDITEEMNQRAEELKGRWESGLTDEELPIALESIASLVMDMRSSVEKGKHDFESFLKELSENLQDIEQHIARAEKTHEETLQDSMKLDTSVSEQLSVMRDNLQNAGDIDTCRTHINVNLEGIENSVHEFLDSEKNRYQYAQEEIDKLGSKMQKLEEEAEYLKSRLIEEHHKALMDTLTGLYNRLAYNERLEQEYSRWKRYRTPLSLVVWDIDHFKKINDTYGHKSGDRALKKISNVIRSNMRETDFLARYGGEEFVALLPETDVFGAMQVAEKIRKTVELSELVYNGNRVLLTITCGISEFVEGDTPDTVFDRADSNLYKGKSGGRNRVITDEDAS